MYSALHVKIEEDLTMTWNRVSFSLLIAVGFVATPGLVQAADYHHVHITSLSLIHI